MTYLTDALSNCPRRVFLCHAFNDQPVIRELDVVLVGLSQQMTHRMNRSLAIVTLLVVCAVAFGACKSAPIADPSLGTGSTQVSDKDGMTLLYVPAGEFLMGAADSDQQALSNERPQHSVYLDAFWIDQTEVTEAMYAKCMKAGACQAPQFDSDHPESVNYPVVFVVWDNAKQYCEWAGGDLPTEAQWEKAARGSDGRLYPWGNQAPDRTRLNYNMEAEAMTPVGIYPAGASPYGALDMAGNVWEWTADWYSAEYYASSPSSNPTGPGSGTYRVLRGGSWFFGASFVRASSRIKYSPDSQYVNVGFRCAR